ncbi:MAG TPA: hypothetical protein DDW89_03625, partial [Gammaproteobacteria bacterium]|nr:hypothetical protein [Gammaproteobacteria bacterium]
ELGRKGEAHVYLGEYLAFQGQTREAITQMTYALQEPDLDDIERTRVENRRKALARRLRAQR